MYENWTLFYIWIYRAEASTADLAGKNARLCKMFRVCAVCVLLTMTKRWCHNISSWSWWTISSILLSGGPCAGLLYLAMSGSVWKLCSDRGRPRGGVPCLKKSRNQFRLYTATASRARNKPSWRFHNHQEGPFLGLFLVESPYERLQVLFENSYTNAFLKHSLALLHLRHYAK